MTRIRRSLPLLLLPLLPLALTGCGTESSAAGGGVDRAELEARAKALGTELDMVYVTDVPGYKVVPQSVGVIGDHGFGAAYTKSGSGVIDLRVDETGGGLADCAEVDSIEVEGHKMTCEQDGESQYRSTKTTHEYVRVDGGRTIWLSAGRDGVPRETLRKAAENAHQADDGELADIMPETAGGSGGGQGGTERGDLPKTGDGAPQDPPGFTEGTSG
ncbi:hypothetical protein ACQUSR_12510 [Streptomyces sp. P1-3]|uniref:hypothetical protein n=1 Tax=Streptomyces sp. P1-3 TaxID=3421658 RepID=UPI003D36F431